MGKVGITHDINCLSFNSAVPTPKSTPWRLAWRLNRPSRASLQPDPWLNTNENNLMAFPPTFKTYEHFKYEFDDFLDALLLCPVQFRKRIERHREALESAIEALEKEQTTQPVLRKKKVRRGSLRSRLGLNRYSNANACSSEFRPSGVDITCHVESKTSSSYPSGMLVIQEHEIQRPCNLDSKHIELHLPVTDPMLPPSPSTDIATEASLRTMGMHLSSSHGPTVLPSSSAGLPCSCGDAQNVGFSPPARSGWVAFPKAGAGSWLQHPSGKNWLYQPTENVYFHCPSDTLWREEAPTSGFATHGLDLLHVKLVTRENENDGDAALDQLEHDETGSIGSSATQSPRHRVVCLPLHGWVRVDDASVWEKNDASEEWLRKPSEGVYFHLDSESLWCVCDDDDDDDDGEDWPIDRICIRPVDEGGEGGGGLPGTRRPSIFSARY